MAWKLVERIGKTRGLPPSEKLVLLALASHCNRETREAYPNRETLAEWTGLTVRTVTRAVDGLVDKGLLIVPKGRAGGRGVSTRYRFGDAAIDAMAKQDIMSSFENKDTESRFSSKRDSVSEKEDIHDRKEGHHVPRTLKEQGSKPRAGARAREGARPPAPEPPPPTPDPRQPEMLMPFRGDKGRASPDPLTDAEERLAAARDSLADLSDDDPMRPSWEAIVTRVEREIAEMTEDRAKPSIDPISEAEQA